MADMNTGPRNFGAGDDTTSDQSQFGTDGSGSRVGSKVRELAATAQHQAGSQVRSQVETGKHRAAGALRDVANTLEHPEDGSADFVSQSVRTASDRARQFADYLDNTDLRDMVADAEGLARRQPALFLGGAFVLGLLAARVLKSTRRRDDRFGSQMSGRAMYDRETSLDSYREPTASSGLDVTGSALGSSGSALSDDIGSSTGLGASGSGLDMGGTSAWTDELGAPGGSRRSSGTNE